jgi:hypothetical protein
MPRTTMGAVIRVLHQTERLENKIVENAIVIDTGRGDDFGPQSGSAEPVS